MVISSFDSLFVDRTFLPSHYEGFLMSGEE